MNNGFITLLLLISIAIKLNVIRPCHMSEDFRNFPSIPPFPCPPLPHRCKYVHSDQEYIPIYESMEVHKLFLAVQNCTIHCVYVSVGVLVSFKLFPKLHSNSCDYLYVIESLGN